MAQEQHPQPPPPQRSMHARVGRDNQRYGPNGERLVAGIVPLSADRRQVLLIQSSSRKGWVLPKGGWEADEASEADAAAREAWEEAGIHVTIERDLGRIEEARGSGGAAAGGKSGAVAAYRFFDGLVRKEEPVWPESHKRTRCWMVYAKAKESLQGRPELLEALERSGLRRD